jgi:hypothetical protein
MAVIKINIKYTSTYYEDIELFWNPNPLLKEKEKSEHTQNIDCIVEIQRS